MLGVMSMATSFKRTYGSMLWLPELLHSVPLTLRQATVDPHLHQRLPDAHWQVWLSLSGSCAFSWVLVSTRLCLCPLRVYFLSPLEVL